jgi:hypothetical protein
MGNDLPETSQADHSKAKARPQNVSLLDWSFTMPNLKPSYRNKEHFLAEVFDINQKQNRKVKRNGWSSIQIQQYYETGHTEGRAHMRGGG